MLDDELAEPMDSVIFSQGSSADPHERLQLALRQHLEHYRDEAKIMGVIEQVARYDDHVAAVRSARNKLHREQIETSIRGMQRRGMADATLDPKIAAAALGSMVERFAEMSLAQGQLNCKLDDAADTLARLFVNALQMQETKVRRSRL